MRETFLGGSEEEKFLQTTIAAIRALDPIEIALVSNPTRLSSLEQAGGICDLFLFEHLVRVGLESTRARFGVELALIPFDRYLLASPGAGEVGGFHDPRSLGYQYWYQAGFVGTLNLDMCSPKLASVELARSYLHDCYHHSTFRSFRRASLPPPPTPAEAKGRLPYIYREQYGLNFRAADGNSYSAVEMTGRVPETINLNLLMDGAVVLCVSSAIKDAIPPELRDSYGIQGEILREVLLEPFDHEAWPRAGGFHDSVTVPSRIFVEHWGGEGVLKLIVQGMMSGNRGELKRFFAERTGDPTAWESRFRRPGFVLPEDPD